MAKEKIKKEKNNIVIEETEADVDLGSEFVGDSEDLKRAVKRDSEKGKFMRIFFPLLVFAIIGGFVGYATWYYTRPERTENTKSFEDKIQTPPVVEEDKLKEDDNKEVKKEEPKEEPANQASTTRYISYTVKSGDTLSGIANNHGLTSQQLADYNGITDVHSLQIGQIIKIPQ